MSSKNSKTSEQVKNYDAWVEYVDPEGVITEEEFERMSSKEKVEIIEKVFGNEVPDENNDF